MNEQAVIRTHGLTRYFGDRPAVYELNLEVPRGGVFALLGRNGSGKTTTIRMLLGLLEPTRGGGSILGYDIRALPPEARARIGYLTEEHQLYGWMKVRECGEFQSRFYPNWNEKVFRGIIGHFGLRPNALVKSLSRGERAGLCLAVTLAPEPELLILDDPAMGLDPVARRSLVESMIYLTRRSDRTIFFSTHQLPDVERVADYIAVLDHSVLRACCPLEAFRNSIRQVRLRFAGAAASPAEDPRPAAGLPVGGRAAPHVRPLQRHHRGGAAGSGAHADGAGAAEPGGRLHQLPRRPGREIVHPIRNGGITMKALVLKEFRENLKLAALGLVIYTVLLVRAVSWVYRRRRAACRNRWLDWDLMWSTAWFCGIFGAVLGWLQIHNERRPDLWAFLMHRPVTRTEIFLGKTLAGLGLYAVVVGAAAAVLHRVGAVAGARGGAVRAGDAAARGGLRSRGHPVLISRGC